MSKQPTRNTNSAKPYVPFDFTGLVEMSRGALTETAKQHSNITATMHALGKEWTEFVAARLREDSQLLPTLFECKEVLSLQRVYAQFWGKALSQYEEETQRLLRIVQGAMEGAIHNAQESAEVTSANASDARPQTDQRRRER